MFDKNQLMIKETKQKATFWFPGENLAEQRYKHGFLWFRGLEQYKDEPVVNQRMWKLPAEGWNPPLQTREVVI